jgi:hypothetical protein
VIAVLGSQVDLLITSVSTSVPHLSTMTELGLVKP